MIRHLPHNALARKRLHLGVCGSVAAYKAVEIMRLLQKAGLDISVCLTQAATRFISPLTFSSLGANPVYTRMFNDNGENTFAHLEPGRQAEALLIAPASATTLARLAHGLADDLLAAQALAFNGPLLLAPAMNPNMWSHPATRHNVKILRKRGVIFVAPESGRVACGDEGEGKLASLPEIVLAAAKALLPQDMAGIKILLTLGPTWERWDGVRIWTNPSSGRMGAALAVCAHLRGAEVFALAGPGVPDLPHQAHRIDVASARQMFDAASDLWPQMDTGLFCAAVADFSPSPFGPTKYKKNGNDTELNIRFLPNPDILATLARHSRPDQKILGFAAETDNLENNARAKLKSKGMGLMAANLLNVTDSGFACANNTLFVCDCRGREEKWPPMLKSDAAWRLLDWLLTL
ncbi:MAG: bifunctional phosphopantothenoylcysteine decarboxylase/phosphopantothenate--cysteine ligase CoaBC [Desulfovibrio sp.]|jgi:phosphopantothenoylcysteine decarboxylase/phosphopantothenate--cysteine ligase|nr:bifunctional phosphopantothenoylcysteine decarboxylase/phosphopantothenate--cysteine ligase CoaBC [Desulfovibrio sp.]